MRFDKIRVTSSATSPIDVSDPWAAIEAAFATHNAAANEMILEMQRDRAARPWWIKVRDWFTEYVVRAAA